MIKLFKREWKRLVKILCRAIILIWVVIFPIFELYSHNISELRFIETVPLLIVYLIIFLGFFLFIYKKISFEKIIYIFFLFNIFSLIYGNITIFLEKYLGQIEFYRDIQFIPLVFILVYFLSKKLNRKVFGFVKLFLIITFIFSVFGIIKSISFNRNRVTNSESEIITRVDNQGLPDIYYYISDEFASSDTILNSYGYDDTEFRSNLENLGFKIYTGSSSAFSSTWPNLSSIFNLTKVDTDIPTKELYDSILNSRVSNQLKSYGYKYIFISDQKLYYGSDKNPYADYSFYDFVNNNKNFVKNKSRINKFTEIFIKSSVFRPLVTSETNNIYRENEILKHVMLKEVVNNYNSPKFVFIHSVISHEPFLFDENGGMVDYSNQNNWVDRNIYLGSYIYSEKTILEDVQAIIAADKNSIIVVQSDHGPRYKELGNEWKKIFNAIYVSPDYAGNFPTENFQNINTFKYILDTIGI